MFAKMAFVAVLLCGSLCFSGEPAVSPKADVAPLSLKRLDSILVKGLQLRGVTTPAFAAFLQMKLKDWDVGGADGSIIVPINQQIKRISARADGVGMKDFLKSTCKANALYWWIDGGRLVISQEAKRPESLEPSLPEPGIAIPDDGALRIIDTPLLGHLEFEELPLDGVLAKLNGRVASLPEFASGNIEIVNLSTGKHLVTLVGDNMTFKNAISYVAQASGLEWWLDGNIVFIGDARKKSSK